MQFFEGKLRMEDVRYGEKENMQIEARTLNTKYWLKKEYLGLHVIVSKMAVGQIVFLLMYEGFDAKTEALKIICNDYISELVNLTGLEKVKEYKNDIVFRELTLNTFCELFAEEWFDKMYEDKDAIMNLLHIDKTKYICNEELLEAVIDNKFIRRYIDQDELARIRNSRLKPGRVTFQPVHYIVVENNEVISEQIDEELLNELRRAGRVASRRIIKLSGGNADALQRNNLRIQNLNNLDGGTVFVDLRSCNIDEARNLILSVYSERNNYPAKYAVIFHVPEAHAEIIDLIEKNCSIWAFVQIFNKRLNRKQAIKQLVEVAKVNNVDLSKDDCRAILKKQKDYAYDEVNEMFRKWLMTEYSINAFHPQYKKVIDDYFNRGKEKGDALAELNALVGLADVKRLCKKIISFYELQKMRIAGHEDQKSVGLHMVFTGNPGTAKTTVARLMARILKQKGILTKEEIVEVGRADLVGKYVGWTARIVKGYFEQAKGGILFIDEAYSLVDDDKSSFGTEAINTIVQEMENNRSDVVVIFAGYKKEMHDFIAANSGLESRVSFFVEFPDYSGNELFEILKIMADKNHYQLGEDVYESFMNSLENKDTTKGNGRIVRNEFENARLRQAERIMALPAGRRKGELFTLIGKDFCEAI